MRDRFLFGERRMLHMSAEQPGETPQNSVPNLEKMSGGMLKKILKFLNILSPTQLQHVADNVHQRQEEQVQPVNFDNDHLPTQYANTIDPVFPEQPAVDMQTWTLNAPRPQRPKRQPVVRQDAVKPVRQQPQTKPRLPQPQPQPQPQEQPVVQRPTVQQPVQPQAEQLDLPTEEPQTVVQAPPPQPKPVNRPEVVQAPPPPRPSTQPQAEQLDLPTEEPQTVVQAPRPPEVVNTQTTTVDTPVRTEREESPGEHVESADTQTREQVILEMRPLGAGPTAVVSGVSLDDRVQGDYRAIMEGIGRFREVTRGMPAAEQAALKEDCQLKILPKGALHAFDGRNVGIDITLPVATLRSLLQREMAPVMFARDVKTKLKAAGFDFRAVVPEGLRMSGLDAQTVSDTIARAMRRVPASVRRTMDLRWLYLCNGEQQHSLIGGGIYTINIKESEEHIATFLMRMLAGTDLEASAETVNANIAERQALEDAVANLRGDRYISSMSRLSSSVVRDFADIQAGITRFRALRETFSTEEKEALSSISFEIEPKGTAARFSGASTLFVDMTISDEAMRGLLRPAFEKIQYANRAKTALEARGFRPIAVHAERIIPDKTPAQASTVIADAVDALGSPLKESIRNTVTSIYITNTGAPAEALSENSILTVNVATENPESITTALRTIYRQRGVDHLYDRIPDARAVDMRRDMSEWIARQRSLSERRSTEPVRLNQNFPTEYRSQLRSLPGIALSNAGGTGPVRLTFTPAVTFGGESVTEWSLASDIHANPETGTADEVYLYPSGSRSQGILLQCSVLFTQDGTLDGARLRRFAALALEHNASERDDPAGIRTFEVAGRTDKIACINLVDDTDEVARGLGQSAEAFTTLLGGRYARKYGADANRLTSRSIAVGRRDNPLRALTTNVDAAVAEGRNVIVINLAAHGDSAAANYAAGNLRATDILALMQRHPGVRFTLFAPNCFGAGFEDAMRDLRDPGGAVGRITVFHHSKQDSTNVALRADRSDPYTTAYDAALHVLMADPANDATPFGELHRRADLMARTRSLRNAGVWRSGGRGPSTNTARLENRDDGRTSV